MELKLYLVTWPDGEKNLVLARDEVDLYLLLDEEADPFTTEIQEIDPSSLSALKIVISDLVSPEELPILRELRLDSRILADVYPVSDEVYTLLSRRAEAFLSDKLDLPQQSSAKTKGLGGT